MKEKQKEKQVVLFVRGTQYYDDIEPEETELMTEGIMVSGDDGAIILEYQETELTGMEGTTTRFTIQDDTVVLTREGSVNSQMVFQRGKRNSSIYETPWGTMLVDISTASLQYRLDAHGGVMEIRYTIAVDHQVTGMSHFKIRVRESMR